MIIEKVDAEKLINNWKKTQGPTHQWRISSKTNNGWFTYKKENGNYCLLLECINNPNINDFPEISGLKLDLRPSRDYFYIVFELLDKNSIDIFASFCVDMINEIEQSPLGSDNYKTAKMAINFTRNYQKFWLTKGQSRNDQLGILGELVFLNDYLVNNIPEKCIDNWVDGSKDFEIEKNFIECKTNQEKNPKIRISSEYQLEIEKDKNLFIFLLKLCANNDDKDKEKITIHSVYEEIKNKLLSEEQKIFFSQTIKSKGFDLENLEEKVFSIDYKKIFHVDDEFPKIIKSKISNSISEVKYRISVNQIQEFEVENNEFTKLIKE